MKEAELRNHTHCNLCHRKIGASGIPMFWRLTVERFGIDLQAVRRQDGLGQFIGSSAIGAAMGPDEDMAKPMMDPVTLTVCETCGTGKMMHVVAAALEQDEPSPENVCCTRVGES